LTDEVGGTYEYNNLNELISFNLKGAPVSFEYDLNGNRTAKYGDGATTAYTYDTSDRLMSATDEVASQTLFTAKYDARTRRLSKTEGGSTTLFRYDGGTNFQELTAGTDPMTVGTFVVSEELIRAGGLGGGIGSVLYSDQSMTFEPGPVDYFIYDALGNTVALTDASKRTSQTTLYDAFGNTVVQTDRSLGWAPADYPETVLVHLTNTTIDDDYTLVGSEGTYEGFDDAGNDVILSEKDGEWSMFGPTEGFSTNNFQWDGSTREMNVDGGTVTATNGGSLTGNSERPASGWQPADYPESITVSVVNSVTGADIPDGDYVLKWEPGNDRYYSDAIGDGIEVVPATSFANAQVVFVSDGSSTAVFKWDGSTRGLMMDGSQGAAAEGLNGYVVTGAINGEPLLNNSERPHQPNTNNRLHNTKERDASIGLDNHGFRYYDPELGSYIQRDPTGYADGMNVYMSVHDNPLNGVDPQGLSGQFDEHGVDLAKALPPDMAKAEMQALFQRQNQAEAAAAPIQVAKAFGADVGQQAKGLAQGVLGIEHVDTSLKSISADLKANMDNGHSMLGSALMVGVKETPIINAGVAGYEAYSGYVWGGVADGRPLSDADRAARWANVISTASFSLAASKLAAGDTAGGSGIAPESEIQPGALEDWGNRTSAADRIAARDAAWDADNTLSIHGNSARSPRTAYLYRLEDLDGNLLKYGITQNMGKRYSKTFMEDKRMFEVSRGSRRDMLTLERDYVERDPGSFNKEPWAGSRAGR
jgi:RHS repeat-associated protein